MPNASRTLRRSLSLGRRLAAIGLLAIQGGIAASPLWEPRHVGRLAVHTEPDGTRHTGLHDEAACVVCAARTLHADVPNGAANVDSASPRHGAVTLPHVIRPTRAVARANLSRAPPLTG